MIDINLNLVVNIIKDNKEHSLYELHKTYRLTPVEARESVSILEKIGILSTKENTFKISKKIENKSLGLLYKEINHREVRLDEKEISEIRNNAINQGGMYFPNFQIIDDDLKVD